MISRLSGIIGRYSEASRRFGADRESLVGSFGGRIPGTDNATPPTLFGP